MGAPHVRDRRGAAALLQLDDLPDRDPDRAEVLQLDRHHVEGPAHLRDPDAVRLRVPGDVPVRRADRGDAGRPPIDFHVTDTYFVVAHFHYVLFGTIVFATYAGIYFWFPKMTGRFLDERLGRLHFWLTFIGFHMTFLMQHWLGDIGMPRRYADYLPTDGFTTLNTVSTIGSFVLGASVLPFLWNVFGPAGTARSPPRTTRGVTATRWSGRPAARRRGTTSPHCPGSAPSGPRSNCTTRTWSSGCAPKPMSAATLTTHHPWKRLTNHNRPPGG